MMGRRTTGSLASERSDDTIAEADEADEVIPRIRHQQPADSPNTDRQEALRAVEMGLVRRPIIAAGLSRNARQGAGGLGAGVNADNAVVGAVADIEVA